MAKSGTGGVKSSVPGKVQNGVITVNPNSPGTGKQRPVKK